MATLDVVTTENKKAGTVDLSATVFEAKVKPDLFHAEVRRQLAAHRRGTHSTKNRAAVSGGGAKPWRQKGTGRARVGEARTPLWRHGGTVFGPQPRDYSYSMPKKARAAALRSVLSQRLEEGALRVVEGFPVEAPKTRELRALLDGLGVAGKAVIVDHEPADALVLSGRNLPGVTVIADSHLTAYAALDCTHLLLSQEAVEKLEERLTPESRG